jgi:hypothetical protein
MNDDFDPRGCQVLLALGVCFWIAVGALVWGWLS